MQEKLKRWEVILMFAAVCVIGGSAWLSQEQAELADRVIRLHVIANSDREEDQALKLAVRDKVLEQAQAIYPEHATLEQARQVLEESLPQLSAAGQRVVEAQGFPYSVTAQLTKCWFPTKEYDEFALPAGDYMALRVVIGEGKGENWWCVAFPPLCLGAASQSVDEAAQAGLFDPEQTALITGENEGYILKFKGMELIGEVKQWLMSRESRR